MLRYGLALSLMTALAFGPACSGVDNETSAPGKQRHCRADAGRWRADHRQGLSDRSSRWQRK
jgi:hypothetical protein